MKQAGIGFAVGFVAVPLIGYIIHHLAGSMSAFDEMNWGMAYIAAVLTAMLAIQLKKA
jgi:hypothetical protein